MSSNKMKISLSSDGVGAGRESEIPLYSNPSNNYII